MSTRASITFVDNLADWKSGEGAAIYQHCDGYPEGVNGVVATFERFCDAMNRHAATRPAYLCDTAFGDAETLAARFVAWLLGAEKRAYIGLMTGAHSDLSYQYAVVCQTNRERPRIYLRRAGEWADARDFAVEAP